MAFPLTLAAYGVRKGANAYNSRALGTAKLEPNSASNYYGVLADAADARVAKIAPDASPFYFATKEQTPDKTKPQLMASHQQATDKETGLPMSIININPNADVSYYAHELGHGISQKTRAGKFVNDARHYIDDNPRLGAALANALMFSSPAVAAALQEGDDDLAGSVALASLVAAPRLVDEALATKNALAIMKDAGIRASMGQRGRLAAGYLSYLAPAIIAGSLGNFAGNLVDDKTALYDF